MKKIWMLFTILIVLILLIACQDEVVETEPTETQTETNIVETYTVTFDTDEANGGQYIQTLVVNHGDLASRPTDPLRVGYLFSQWYLDQEYTQVYDWQTPVTMNITLYAKWIEDEPTVPNGLDPLIPLEGCEVPTLEGGWTCIWADEFNGTELDETKWNVEVNGDGGGNNELQYYRRENIEIVDGKLVITAKNESYLGKPYTSGRINTKYKGTFENVRIVVSAKMPTGRGTWPAIWMMPLMNAYGGWPNSGEIDIMEFVGYDPDTIHSTIHTRSFNHKLGTQLGYSMDVAGVSNDFFTYELIWSPGKLLTYVNGQQIGFGFSYNAAFNDDIPYHYAFPFDREFFLILNLAVGGDWGGVQGVDSSAFPTTLEVDYVRVYKLDYATLDKEVPSTPSNMNMGALKNSIYWTPSTDDYGVEAYEVYVDGSYYMDASLNQLILTGLTPNQTYEIRVRAIDFVGRVSPLSGPISITYQS